MLKNKVISKQPNTKSARSNALRGNLNFKVNLHTCKKYDKKKFGIGDEVKCNAKSHEARVNCNKDKVVLLRQEIQSYRSMETAGKIEERPLSTEYSRRIIGT